MSKSFLGFILLCVCVGHASAQEPTQLRGDVGVAVYASNNPVRTDGDTLIVVPFTYFDYGAAFARFDTFGVKLLPLGYGHLELLGRINFDGYRTDNPVLRGLHRRRSSLPLGLGTFQETPWGGVFLNAFHDVRSSYGDLFEVIYVAQFEIGDKTVYPIAGVERLSAAYTRYYYGVSAAESTSSRYASYVPAATNTPMLGMTLEIPFDAHWSTDIYLLRRWLGPAITHSPLVDKRVQDEAFVSFSRHYD